MKNGIDRRNILKVLFALPANAGLVGFPLAFQSAVLDPASSLSFVLSNAMSLVLAF